MSLTITDTPIPTVQELGEKPIANKENEKFSYVTAFAEGGYTFEMGSETRDKVRVIGMWILSFIFPIFPAITFLACWIKDVLDTLKPTVEVPPPPVDLPEEVNLDDIAEEDDEEADKVDEEPERLKGDNLFCSQDAHMEMADTFFVPENGEKITTVRFHQENEHIPIEEETAVSIDTLRREASQVEMFAQNSSPLSSSNDLPPPSIEVSTSARPIPPVAMVVPPKRDLFDKGDLLSGVRKGKLMPHITRMMQAFAEDLNPSWVKNPGECGDKIGNLTTFEILSGILSTKENIQYLSKAAGGWTANLILNALAEDITRYREGITPQEWQRQAAAFEKFAKVQPGTFTQYSDSRKLLDAVVKDPWTLHKGIQASLRELQARNST